MKSRLAASRLLVFVTLFLIPLAAGGASVADARGALTREDARKQLAEYFANVSRNSPTVLGELAKSPATMKAIQERIASMSGEELDRLRTMMEESPDWKLAPEAFAAAFPPEVLEQVRRVGGEAASNVPEGDAMRDDVATLVAVLRQLPDGKLAELGIDRSMLGALEQTFSQMTPLQAALLQEKVAASGFDAGNAAALRSMPEVLQRGALALAQHGPLTADDRRDLESFRISLVGLFDRIAALPPTARATLKAEGIGAQISQIESATPDVLFMVRHHVPAEMIRKLEKNVAFLEETSNLSAEKKEELETFRGDFVDAFASIEGSDRAEIEKMMGALDAQELYLLQRRMAAVGSWKTALPILYQTLGSPDVRTRLAALESAGAGSPDAQALEMFRGDMVAAVRAASLAEGANPELGARALRSVEGASLSRLEMMRSAVRSLSSTPPPDDLLTVVAMYDVDFNCNVNLGCIDFVVDEWCLSFSLDFICNPIESAIEAVANGITATVNTIVATASAALQATISTVQNALNAAISAVTSTVNTLVSGIQGVVNTISSFIQTIPDLAWGAIQAALNLLLDIEVANGITVRDLVAEGVEHALESMHTALGLAGNWWSAVSTFTLPAIPCPPSGFHTPFGDVGDSAAAANYGRYRLLIDNVVGMIPDTETSLAIKIPAQVLYMAFDFLGVCLEQAAADADTAEATARHNLVLTNFSGMQTYIGTQIAGIAAQSGSQTDALVASINAQSSIIQNLVNNQASTTNALVGNESDETETLVNAEADAIRALLGSESTDIQSAVEEFQTLNLRLIVERALQAGVGSGLVLLQLPEPWGQLGLVRDTVQQTIQAMAAANQGVGQANQLFDKGVQAMNAGRFKDAFTQFAMAYRDATK